MIFKIIKMKVINTFLAIILISVLSAFTVLENEFPPIDVKSLDGKSVNVQDYVGKGKVTVVKTAILKYTSIKEAKVKIIF